MKAGPSEPTATADIDERIDLDHDTYRVQCNLALVTMWAQAESETTDRGSDDELESDAWYALAMMLHDARAVLKRADKARTRPKGGAG